MVFQEVSVTEIREVLRSWPAGTGLRTVAGQAGMNRKPPAGMSRRRWQRADPGRRGRTADRRTGPPGPAGRPRAARE
jgi:hypothetical protein